MNTNGKKKKAQLLGRYIVADPKICHGQLTFIGTRILVSDVLEMVASGMSWSLIEKEWRGSVTKEAIAEAVRIASTALYDHSEQYAIKQYAAS
jgi:uncharacterized protein (DUF433 family)